MARQPTHDPVLTRFRAAVRVLYGDRVERVVLYGSRARGDARADSDYDIALFLRAMPDRMEEMRRLAEMETEILHDTGALINTLPFPAGAWGERTAFMGEVRREGVEV